MQYLEDFADDLGPIKILEFQQSSVGLKAAVVVDNVAAGPSIGVCEWHPMLASRSASGWHAP
jgi:glutamate dehydrogenase (NAD(P)+)